MKMARRDLKEQTKTPMLRSGMVDLLGLDSRYSKLNWRDSRRMGVKFRQNSMNFSSDFQRKFCCTVRRNTISEARHRRVCAECIAGGYPVAVSEEKKDWVQQSVGLCADCRFMRRMESDRGSIFYLCERSATDARFPKYPRLPVLRCAGREPLTDGRERVHE
jgi:hypothetical protein